MNAMDREGAEEAMAQLRLRVALEEHIRETETAPPELSQAVRDAYRERMTDRNPHQDGTP